MIVISALLSFVMCDVTSRTGSREEFPVYKWGGTTGLKTILWDNDDLLKLLKEEPGGKNVVWYIWGHNHTYSYSFIEDSQIHHLVMPSPMLVPPGDPTPVWVFEFSIKNDAEDGSSRGEMTITGYGGGMPIEVPIVYKHNIPQEPNYNEKFAEMHKKAQ